MSRCKKVCEPPKEGMQLLNGAVVTNVHKQYPNEECTMYLIEAYWGREPYTPYLVWDYNAAAPRHASGGSYCDSADKQRLAFERRKYRRELHKMKGGKDVD